MTAIVRGTLVSNSVKLLLEKFVSTEFVDNFASTKLEVSYLKKLKTTLTWVQDILNDAEEQNVFEVANLLDEINTEALRRKAEAEYEILTSFSLVLKTIFSPFKRLSSVINFKIQESWKKVGEEYFDELVSRSLIHGRSIDDEEVSFEMNNLIHDLATMVSFPYCIRFDDQILHERVHYLSYNRELYDSFYKFDKLYGLKDLRTFLGLPLQEQLPLCLLSNKRNITEVPNSIGNLLHPRYLNLSYTKIERLPSATCQLYNLQFLLVSGCKRLSELPEDIGKLDNLRHLDVSGSALREIAIQIAKLENLQTLSDFVVNKHNGGLKVRELGKFPHLQGKLSISQLQYVNDPFEASLANMTMKEQIDELALEWDCGSAFSDSQIQIAVLEHLQPSTNLRSLTIKGYGGISFPIWLGDSLFRNMVYLRISNCDECLWLPPLGQLRNLKELVIEGMQSIETMGILPVLKSLFIEG
ncbi:hypothetical protein RYX36_001794 [Vicia faba]